MQQRLAANKCQDHGYCPDGGSSEPSRLKTDDGLSEYEDCKRVSAKRCTTTAQIQDYCAKRHAHHPKEVKQTGLWETEVERPQHTFPAKLSSYAPMLARKKRRNLRLKQLHVNYQLMHIST